MTRVLIADDDLEMRQLLALLLTQSGYEVELAADGNELLQRLNRADAGDAPDVVVTDVHMPGWGGLQVLPWVRNWRPQTPIVLITAFAEPEVRALADELGAAAVLDKPFDVDALTNAIDELLTRVARGAPPS